MMTRRRDTRLMVASLVLALLCHVPVFGVLGWYFEQTRASVAEALEASWHCPCE